MRLVVVRHLPTQWNLEDRLQGRRDLPILARDVRGDSACANALSAIERWSPFDEVFCSTLRRTRQTAEAFGFSSPIEDADLDELDFGPVEGRLRSEMLAAVGDAWKTAPDTLTFGEPVLRLETRIRSFLRRQRDRNAVLVFGHGAWSRALFSLHTTGALRQMNQVALEHGAAIELDLSGSTLLP